MEKYFLDNPLEQLWPGGQYSLTYDSNGITRISYPDTNYFAFGVKEQYHPTVIAAHALSQFNKFIDTKGEQFKECFLKCADWLVDSLAKRDNCAAWTINFSWESPGYRCKAPWISSMTHGLGISGLMRAWMLTENIRYLNTAERVLSVFEVPVSKGGLLRIEAGGDVWYEDTPSPLGGKVLNEFLFALIGLYEMYHYEAKGKAKALFDQGVKALKDHLRDFDLNLLFFTWSRYDNRLLFYAGDKYHQVQKAQLRFLYKATGIDILSEYAQKWETCQRRYAPANNVATKRIFEAFYYSLYGTILRFYTKYIQTRVTAALKGEMRLPGRLLKHMASGTEIRNFLFRILSPKDESMRALHKFRKVLLGLKPLDLVYFKCVATTMKKGYRDIPAAVYLESTNACNFHCRFCPRNLMTRKIGCMDMESFKRHADECITLKVGEVRLHNYGEPLLDSNIVKKINYLKEGGIEKVGFYTNAYMLDSALSKEIIQSGLDFMYVSFPGLGDKEYEYSCGSCFRTVKENLIDFFKIRRQTNSKRPRTTILIRHAGELSLEEKKFVRYWKSFADSVAVSGARDLISQVAGVRGDTPKVTKKILSSPCPRLWSRVTVLWDGRVALCCRDMNGEHIVGDANRETLYDIWNSPQFKLIRQKHLNRQFEDIPLCERCDEIDLR